MTRKIARSRRLVTGMVTGAVVAAALAGCAADGSPAGSAPPSATRSAEEGAATSGGAASDGAASDGAASDGATAADATSESASSEDAPAVAGCSGDLTTDIPPVEIDVRLVDGQVEPAPDRVEVPLGTTVVLRAEADAPAEIHVHGYDVAGEAAPGEPACLEVLADTPGVYDVEAHPETLLLQLAVR
ncbi:hypothetical protein AB1046_05260 [Promicromonospora sp. Populi]|uniref:hypothetical protein n=1 Tax=Promicromonospora sp. Populi TaxID=3239420 RepID=UPI0034E1E25B